MSSTIQDVLSGDVKWSVNHSLAEDLMATMPDNSVDLILVDPPYFRVKDEPWDRQWDNPAAFLAWMGSLCEEWKRILKPNGSLYVFASPQMAARVEVKIGDTFNVLTRITWRKDAGWAKRTCKEDLRQFFPSSEAIIFAEHFGADNIAKGEAGYGAKCDELRGFVFEPIRAYLDGERRRAGVAHRAVITHLGMGGHDSHFFSPVQWKLPLPEQYEAMRQLFNARGGDHLSRPYEFLHREYEELLREYDTLRQQFEQLRRPFSVTADVPYTDVWDFPTVQAYPGKHVCEKPQPLLEHIIRSSSREDAVVFDCFAGSGATGVAALNLGRQFIGCDASEHWAGYTANRLHQLEVRPVVEQVRLFL